MTEENLEGVERRQGYTELAARIDKHAHDVEQRLERFFAKALAAFAVIGLASAIALLGFGYVLQKQGIQADDIQDQRYEVLVENCQRQNARHDRTIARANSFLDKEARRTVIILVNELQPFIPNCEELARAKVKG